MNKIKAAHMEVRKMVANGATDFEIRAFVDSVLGVKPTNKWACKVVVTPFAGADNPNEYTWSYHKTIEAAEKEIKRCMKKAPENKYKIEIIK